jgi:hypothetical protein
MAKIHRFSSQSAGRIAMAQAQQVGLPVQMPQVQQGVIALLNSLYQQGIFLAVDDTSPYFARLSALSGQTQNTRVPGSNGHGHAPQGVPMMPQQMQPQMMPQQPQHPQMSQVPMFYPLPPQQVPFVPQGPSVPMQVYPVPQAPMPPMQPRMPVMPVAQIPQPGVPHPVPVQAPIQGQNGDAPPSMTDMPTAP